MSTKKLILIVLAIFVLGLGVVAAQDDASPHRRFRGGAELAGVVHEAIEAASEATGLSASDIYTQLADGVSLAEIVTENGGDPATVIEAAVAAANERIDLALAEGRITDERADEFRANVEEAVTNAVNGDFAPFRHGRDIRGGRMNMLTENDVDVDAFIEDAVARVDERLNRLVERGAITEERAGELLDLFREHLTEHMHTTVGEV